MIIVRFEKNYTAGKLAEYSTMSTLRHWGVLNNFTANSNMACPSYDGRVQSDASYNNVQLNSGTSTGNISACRLVLVGGLAGDVLVNQGGGEAGWNTILHIPPGTVIIASENLVSTNGAGISLTPAATDNIILGTDAGPSIVATTRHVCIGADSNCTSNVGAVAVGANAIAGGNRAVALGMLAATGGGLACIMIGSGAGVASATGVQNIGLGQDCLNTLSTGGSNFAAGLNAGDTITDGSNNICVGPNSDCATSNDDAVAIGNNALGQGDETIAIGVDAASGTGEGCVMIGTGAGVASATGAQNIGLGQNCLNTLSTGGSNFAAGLNAGNTITDGNRNVCVGPESDCGPSNDDSVAIGSTALAEGNRTVAIGINAATGTGEGCVMIGSGAGVASATGNHNIGLAQDCLNNLSTGECNVAAGLNAGNTITDGNRNVCVGPESDCGTSNSNAVAIGNTAVAEGTNTVSIGTASATGIGTGCIMIGNSAGNPAATEAHNIGIGQAAMNALEVGRNNIAVGVNAGSGITSGDTNVCLGAGSGGANLTTQSNVISIIQSVPVGVTSNETYFPVFTNTTGSTTVSQDANGRLIRDTSSLRYKTNVRPLEIDSAVIYHMNAKSFEYRNQSGLQHRTSQFGFIAEEMIDLVPEIVPLNREGQPESINYRFLTVLLVEEMKKLRERVEKLEVYRDAVREYHSR